MTHCTTKPLYALMLAALALSLSACASKPTVLHVASPCPQLPPVPSLSTPLPPVSYSLTAADAIKSWQSRLTATQLMSD